MTKIIQIDGEKKEVGIIKREKNRRNRKMKGKSEKKVNELKKEI